VWCAVAKESAHVLCVCQKETYKHEKRHTKETSGGAGVQEFAEVQNYKNIVNISFWYVFFDCVYCFWYVSFDSVYFYAVAQECADVRTEMEGKFATGCAAREEQTSQRDALRAQLEDQISQRVVMAQV